MPVGIISRNWIKSLGKGEDAEREMTHDDESDAAPENQQDAESDAQSEQNAETTALDAADEDGAGDDEGSSEDGDSRPFRLGDKRGQQLGKDETGSSDEEDYDEEDEEEVVETEGEDDPLAPAYDLEHGELLLEDVDHAQAQRKPVRSEIKSAKEFFSTEILYRFDVLEPVVQESLSGSYRIELKGFQGGVWTMTVGEEVDVVNRREDAETILSMQQTDFLQLVNGDLNPQIALLAQKVKVTGDIDKAIALQYLLVPALD
ncbi:MAG: SCP2 sterol-binding domain-containing protein [Bdellovibrionales bacterium]|nr:SCP2 sterol-binding domain-containing protein [Bdellovibrionales bacterium]